jgi:hypothetical protein
MNLKPNLSVKNMNKKFYLFMLLVPYLYVGQAQNPIDIYESTMKIGGRGTEEYLCGFAEGDQLVFNFEEINKKELTEVEILEYPSSSKFMDYKTSNITNKVLNIARTGVYKFRFSNSALIGRICKIKIQRIPSNEQTKNFNTTVYWKIKSDTTFEDIQEKYLIRADTIINNITDQVAKVHSTTNLEGSKTAMNFILPLNTVAWSYYIGVDQTSQKIFADATHKIAETASPLVSSIPGYGPLAALALNGTSYLTSAQTGENVQYWFVSNPNQSLFIAGQRFNYIKNGNVINDFSRMISPLKGQYFLCLYNDNAVQAIDVIVKITAVCVNEQWGTRNVRKIDIKSVEVPYLKN